MCPGDFYKWLPWKEPLTAAFQEHTRRAESGKRVLSGGSNDFESPCVSRGARAGGGRHALGLKNTDFSWLNLSRDYLLYLPFVH